MRPLASAFPFTGALVGGILLFVRCEAYGRGAAQATAFPEKDWQQATPESQGLDSGKLRQAVDLLDRTVGKDGARQLVVVRHGRLIWKGPDADAVHGVWSLTKSFTSTVLGLLIDDGKCTLDTRAADFVPELKAHYSSVTLRHFTTMTSGYRAVGDEPKGSYLHGPSSTPFLPSPEPLFTPPGSQYAYWDSAMNEFALVLTRIAGEPLEELFKRRIADPIGMDPRAWRWGVLGTDRGLAVNGGSGNADKHVFISAIQTARLGLLFLNRGNWRGRQLISADWVEQATSVQVPAAMPWAQPQSEIDGRGCYGFNWWANGVQADGTHKWPGAPAGTFAGSGHNNNRLFVIPEWDMVIVRLGLDGRAPDRVWSDFLAKVGEAIAPGESPLAASAESSSVGARGGRFSLGAAVQPSLGAAVELFPQRSASTQQLAQPQRSATNPGDLLFHCDFDSPEWFRQWGLRQPPERAELVSKDPHRKFQPLRGSALRIRIDRGGHYGLSIEFPFQKRLGYEPEEVYFRYYLRLADDWDPRRGGKLPGFSGTYGRAGWGGRPVSGSDGWSARGLFEGQKNGKTPIGFYCYHMDMKGAYGSGWLWDRDGLGLLENNRWYAIEQYVKLNTPGQADGILRGWVDGRLAFEKTDVRMRSVDQLKVQSVWINFYLGGTWTAEREHHAYMDEVAISTRPIGPLKPPPPGS